jgi:type IV secretory pathway VirD2 relaxase
VSDFQIINGFEDVWRPPVRPRALRTSAVLSPRAGGSTPAEIRARLIRVIHRAPEVMVKVTGRTRDPGHLRAHLDYISRNGALDVEDRDGTRLDGRVAVKELAEDWSDAALADRRRRANTPFSVSIVLSMPAETEPIALRDAARDFARQVFSDRFDYAFVLHTDVGHPHIHLAVRALGDHGERLNPKKADLDAWRQVFAETLRDRGIDAEATPRRARGVTRKAERAPLRKIRDRHEVGRGDPARLVRSAYHEAAKAAFRRDAEARPWETRLLDRQARIRSLYLAQARLLANSSDPDDRALAAKVDGFVRSMPDPDSRRLALARELRAANMLDRGRERDKDR